MEPAEAPVQVAHDVAERVYRALVSRGESTFGDLRVATGLDARVLEEALVGLRLSRLVSGPETTREKTGCAEGVSGGWCALSPETALLRLEMEVDEEIHRLRARLIASQERMAVLRDVFSAGRAPSRPPTAGVEMLTDAESVRDRLSLLAASVRNVVVAVHPTMAPPEVLEAGYGLDRKLLARGVDYRLVWPHSARRQTENVAYMLRLIGDGARIRTAALPPSRMIMVDGEVALIPLPPSLGAGAALVTDPAMLHYLSQTFEYTWERATDVEAASYDDSTVDDIERAILHDMVLGRTDEAIARRLGVSTRTLRRYISNLAASLGVDSRFQLALVAERAGLINPDSTLDAPREGSSGVERLDGAGSDRSRGAGIDR
ncbi:MAG: LuxR C-terminal-related transcriptional regulator [Dermatophilaceae bacterium]